MNGLAYELLPRIRRVFEFPKEKKELPCSLNWRKEKDMEIKSKCKPLEAPEVRSRAATIRNHWTPLEKMRRRGLPPDLPRTLQEYLFGAPQQVWCLATKPNIPAEGIG